MKALYESYFIQAHLRLKLGSDRWLVRVSVSRQGDSHVIRRFDGPPDGFQTKEEAESYGIQVGCRWVDEAKSSRDELRSQ